MKTIITIFFCLQILSSAALAGKKRMTTDEWLVLRHSQIEAYTDISKVPLAKLVCSPSKNKSGYYEYSPSRNGLIKFKDGTWVIITSHSMHKEDGIGDISLIKTSEGKYYTNMGHNCSSLMMRSKVHITSLKGFLSSVCVGDKADVLLPWKEYKK